MSKPSPTPHDFDMEQGPCLWCGQYVISDREATGATNPNDPSWTVLGSGDFSCFESPETNEDGIGDHARPFDARLWLKAFSYRDDLTAMIRKLIAAIEEPGDLCDHDRHNLITDALDLARAAEGEA